ncbi:MAG TPA: ATP-binding protein [Stellaceae bacterium]|nr:ATP-binding protein [Stellaceae bacterium]
MIATRLKRDAQTIAATAARLARRLTPGAGAGLRARARTLLSGRTQAVWIVVVTGGFAMALSGMFHWMSWNSRQTVVADTYSSSSNLALSVEQFVARTMETVDLTLRIVTEKVVADGANSGRDLQMLLADRIRHSPQMTGLMVIGPDGIVRSSAGDVPKPGTSLANSKYFIAARGNADIQVLAIDPATAHGANKRLIFVARRFARPSGAFGGVVAAMLSADYVQRFISTLHVGDHSVIALQTIDGTMLVRQPYQEASIGQSFASTPLFREWLPWASSGVFRAYDEDDKLWRIVGYQRIDRLPLVVHVALSENEALTNWRRTTLWQGTVGVVILMLAAVTAYVLHRQLQGRMRAHAQLSDTVRELERARLAAEEGSRVKSQFMANMSHELRTPLNAVIGYSEMLIEDAEGDRRREQHLSDLRRINIAGQHLLGLITDVLDISEIEVGRFELREAPVDVATLVGDCRSAIAARVRAAGLELVTEPIAGLPMVMADERRLRQIVLNLLTNAVKFTPSGGRIVLAASVTAEGGIALSVADTGIGMRPEEIPLALETFRQVDGGLTRRQQGTGLGLPLARTLAELHGGTLAIASAPGKGTAVTVTLPRERVIRRPIAAVDAA